MPGKMRQFVSNCVLGCFCHATQDEEGNKERVKYAEVVLAFSPYICKYLYICI